MHSFVAPKRAFLMCLKRLSSSSSISAFFRSGSSVTPSACVSVCVQSGTQVSGNLAKVLLLWVTKRWLLGHILRRVWALILFQVRKKCISWLKLANLSWSSSVSAFIESMTLFMPRHEKVEVWLMQVWQWFLTLHPLIRWRGKPFTLDDFFWELFIQTLCHLCENELSLCHPQLSPKNPLCSLKVSSRGCTDVLQGKIRLFGKLSDQIGNGLARVEQSKPLPEKSQ